MVFARWQATITDAAGNVVPAASIEVRRELVGAPLALPYADRDGAIPLGNPFPAGPDGFAAFHAPGGVYRITASKGAFTRTWRYVAIGLAAEGDGIAPGTPFLFSTATADADPGAGMLRLNHAVLANVTEIYVDDLSARGVAISAWLDTFDDGGSSANRGTLTIMTVDGGTLLLAQVTGVVVDGSGYRKISVTPLVTAGSFSEGAPVFLSFAGKGVDGQVAGPGTAVAGQVAVFADAIGNSIAGAVAGAAPVLVGSVGDVRSAVPGRLIHAGHLEAAAAPVALTDAATVALDWDSGINFTLTIAGNRTIGNPANGQPGTFRTIMVQGNDGTGRTIAFGNQFLGELPNITDCTSARWYLLTVYCHTASHFVVSAKRAMG